MRDPNTVPTARDIMTRSLVTLKPDTGVMDAVGLLAKSRISGAPVVEPDDDRIARRLPARIHRRITRRSGIGCRRW